MMDSFDLSSSGLGDHLSSMQFTIALYHKVHCISFYRVTLLKSLGHLEIERGSANMERPPAFKRPVS